MSRAAVALGSDGSAYGQGKEGRQKVMKREESSYASTPSYMEAGECGEAVRYCQSWPHRFFNSYLHGIVSQYIMTKHSSGTLHMP